MWRVIEAKGVKALEQELNHLEAEGKEPVDVLVTYTRNGMAQAEFAILVQED